MGMDHEDYLRIRLNKGRVGREDRFPGLSHVRGAVKRTSEGMVRDLRMCSEEPYGLKPCTVDVIVHAGLVGL